MSKPIFKKALVILLLSLTLVASTPNLIAFAVSPLKITVKTNKTTYHLRENVDVSGNVTFNGPLVDKGLAGIQVESPLGILVVRTRPVGPIGSQTFPVQIVQVTLSDMYGNPRQTLVRPSVSPPPATYFTIKVKNNGAYSRAVRITGNVYDNDTIPIGTISLGTTLIGNGWANFTGQVNIEQWVKNGTGTIYANVYSDWPKDYGYPLCPEKAATFAILESDYDESLPGQVPQQPIQNGTYNVIFRLSPEPKPGTYEVYATASYLGWSTDQPAMTTFQVVNIAAPPRASFVIKPPRATINYDITFDASSSTPEGYNENITNYKWNFGDSQQGTGKIVHHSYTSFGNYTVTLNVTDSDPHGYWNTTTRIAVIQIIHDVAILNMSCLNTVYNDWKPPVYVRVKNRGTVPESFNVTLYAEGLFGGTNRTSNLAAYAISTIKITWNTAGLTLLQNDTLTAIADTVAGETSTTDNTCTYGPILIILLGDVKFDRTINILDVVKVTGVYGLKTGDTNYNIMADLQLDGKIDILDVVKVTSRYAQKY